jgi:hypothetical protein
MKQRESRLIEKRASHENTGILLLREKKSRDAGHATTLLATPEPYPGQTEVEQQSNNNDDGGVKGKMHLLSSLPRCRQGKEASDSRNIIFVQP